MFYSFIQLLIDLCLPIILSSVYGTCVYFAYSKVTTPFYSKNAFIPSCCVVVNQWFRKTMEVQW